MKLSPGELIFPIVVAAFTIYIIWDQIIAGHRILSIMYSCVLGVPLIILGTIIVLKFINSRRAGKTTNRYEKKDEAANYPKSVLFFLFGNMALVASLNLIGYIPAIFIFLVICLWFTANLSISRILVLSAGVTIFIYIAFEVYLKLDLPHGFLRDLF